MSTPRQKDDLARQIADLTAAAQHDGYAVFRIYSDVASGLSETRKGVRQRFKMCVADRGRHIKRVYVTFRDRLARFGTRLLEALLKWLGIELVVVGERGRSAHETEGATYLFNEFIQDFLAILTSFTGKFYRHASSIYTHHNKGYG